MHLFNISGYLRRGFYIVCEWLFSNEMYLPLSNYLDNT